MLSLLFGTYINKLQFVSSETVHDFRSSFHFSTRFFNWLCELL